jgi:hypothetical protein
MIQIKTKKDFPNSNIIIVSNYFSSNFLEVYNWFWDSEKKKLSTLFDIGVWKIKQLKK